MQVTINGEPRELTGQPTIIDLLNELGFGPRRVAVERNKVLVRRARFHETPLADGDVLEIVTLVGGG